MTADDTALAPWHQQFDAAMTRHQHASVAQKDARQQAFSQFLQLGLPHRKQEAWRSLALAPRLAEVALSLATDQTIVAADLPPALAEASPRRVISNGYGQPEFGMLPNGESSLARDMADPLRLAANPFYALNRALFADETAVTVPQDTVLDVPMQWIFLSQGQGQANYPRSTVVLEAGAQATVVAEYRGRDGYFVCPHTRFILGENAVLNYVQLQFDSAESVHVGTLQVQQARGSRAQVHLLNFAGGVSRTDVAVALRGEQAHCSLFGLGLGQGQRIADFHVVIDHAVPHTTSHQNFKFILQDRSQGHFDGLIYVAKGAQKTDAFQQSRNLLLSPQAQGQSNPRLEIYADDVKCSHGSTTGFLDQDALFYLQARGIPKAVAQRLLVRAFAAETFESLTVEALRTRLDTVLAQQLGEDQP